MKKTMIILIFSQLMLVLPILSTPSTQDDPYYDKFFRYTRLIMSRQEIETYQHLPDNQSRKLFIKDFWDKRDPSPNTALNENKVAFAQRIQYANKWFHEGRGTGRNKMGWDSLRGRIFLQIGPPSIRQIKNISLQDYMGHLATTRRAEVEYWIYHRYNLVLMFIANQYREYDFFGKPPARLGSVLKMAKNQFNYADKDLQHRFAFTLTHKKKQLMAKIPVKKLSFDEQDGLLKSRFEIKAIIYQNYQNIHRITKEITLEHDKTQLLSKKHLEIPIPYPMNQRGKYEVEVIIKEISSGSMYRITKTIKV